MGFEDAWRELLPGRVSGFAGVTGGAEEKNAIGRAAGEDLLEARGDGLAIGHVPDIGRGEARGPKDLAELGGGGRCGTGEPGDEVGGGSWLVEMELMVGLEGIGDVGSVGGIEEDDAEFGVDAGGVINDAVDEAGFRDGAEADAGGAVPR